MCGRYVIEFFPDEIHERFQLRKIPASLFASFNAAPTQELPVILERADDERELAMMRWGLIPRWAKPGDTKAPVPFNARAESLLEKPMFRSLVGKRRCLVPAKGYYEWKTVGGKKQPYLFTLPGEEMFAFAGLYDEIVDADGEVRASYTVITTEANEMASEYHHRMPVILPRAAEAEWIDPEVTEPRAVEHLLVPYDSDAMAARPVSPAVGNVRNNSRALIEDEGEREPEGQTSLF